MGAVNHLGAKETLLMEPGLLFDLWALYLHAKGIGQEKEDFSDADDIDETCN